MNGKKKIVIQMNTGKKPAVKMHTISMRFTEAEKKMTDDLVKLFDFPSRTDMIKHIIGQVHNHEFNNSNQEQ